MITVLDQLGYELNLKNYPSRVVSLVPSMTELWAEMNGIETLIGRTKFCIHPNPQIKEVYKIGGTKNPRIDDIINLKPDLILANKEENEKSHIETLRKFAPVYTSDIKTVTDNISMAKDFENLSASPNFGAHEILEAYQKLKTKTVNKTAIYLIWKNPYMLAGGDTFINEMMTNVGFKNLFSNKSRYPTISLNDIQKLNPEYILLSSEPYPFKSKDINELKKLNINSSIILVDGEAFSWYGSKILHSIDYLKALQNSINSEL